MATSGSTTARPAITHETRKARFAELLAAKVGQGYDVESQHIAIDENGVQVTRSID
jgi:hypothetical protein